MRPQNTEPVRSDLQITENHVRFHVYRLRYETKPAVTTGLSSIRLTLIVEVRGTDSVCVCMHECACKKIKVAMFLFSSVKPKVTNREEQ